MEDRTPPHCRRSRRAVLATLGSLAAGSLAGCIGDDAQPRIDVPAAAPLDRPVEPTIRGLESDRATVTAETTAPEGDATWAAEATFEVEDGRVDLATDAPVEGDYEGADPMGLFWAMESDQPPRRALFPLATHDVELAAREGSDEPVAETTTTRELYEADTEPFTDDVVGTIHLPEGEDPAPAVLLLHGSGGEPSEAGARAFAGRGFVAGSLHYFGEPEPIPDGLTEVPVEYVGRAIDQLLAHERVAGDSVGLYGTSRGAELALVAGAHLDRIGAIASVSGSGVVWEGVTADRRSSGGSSWSLDGEPVPYVPTNADQSAETSGEVADQSFAAADQETIEAATIPVERADAPILAVSGGDDRVWDAVRFIRVALERLQVEADAPDTDHLVYEAAGHAIAPPYLPTYGSSGTQALQLGGTPEANATAAADHWPQLLEFFERELGA